MPAADGVALGARIGYNFHAMKRVAAPASFNEEYVAALRHMNSISLGAVHQRPASLPGPAFSALPVRL